MRKVKYLLFSIVFMLSMAASVRAEDYISKTFPSNDIILKELPPGSKIVGKYKEGDNTYSIFATQTGNSKRVGKIIIQKLDTDIWIVNNSSILLK